MMKKTMLKKAAAAVLCTAMVVSLAACGGGSGTKETAAAGSSAAGSEAGSTGEAAGEKEAFEINVHNGSEPASLDPNALNSNDSMITTLHMFEGLAKYAKGGEGVELGQAKDYTVSDDGLVYTFTLRDDIFWSDGQPVVAGDFVYSWQRLVSGGYENSYFIDMVQNAVEIQNGAKDKSELGVKAIDDKTLEVTLKAPCNYFIEIVAAAVTSPVRQDIIEANGEMWYENPETYIGNGAYKLVEWSHQEKIVMEANDKYYDYANLGPTKITRMLMDDDNAILAAFESGDLAYAASFPTEELDRLKEAGTFQVAPVAGTYYILVNAEGKGMIPELQDPKVRRALALAIDRNYVTDMVTKRGELPADTFLPRGFHDEDGKDYYDSADKFWDNSTYEANCEEAKKLMAEAGYPDGAGFPTISYTINNNSAHAAIAEYVQNVWKEVLGVDCTIDSQEFAVFLDMRSAGDYALARAGWTVDYMDPASLMELWITSSGNNDCHFYNEEYDSYISAAAHATSQNERFENFHKAEKILEEQLPIIPIYYYSEPYLMDTSKYDGFFSYLAMPVFKYVVQK